MPADFAVVVAVGDIERERRDGAEPAHAQTRAVARRDGLEGLRRAADVMEYGQCEIVFNRILVFQAGHKHGAFRQDHGAAGQAAADAVQFVTAHGRCAAGAEHERGGHAVGIEIAFAINITQFAAHHEGA